MLPTTPGLYINGLTNEEGICIFTGDKRREGRGLAAKKGNIKFGIAAIGIQQRFKHYIKSFGDNVENEWFIELPDYDKKQLLQIEKEVLKEIDEFRTRNPHTGRKLEWLENITKEQLIPIIMKNVKN